MAEAEGFEPPRVWPPVSFQDWSLQPDLGTPPFWWILQGSNLRPVGYEPNALTSWAKDPFYTFLVAGMRFELMTFRVWTERSNHLSYPALIKMVELIGIEPTTFCVQNRCSPSWATAPILSGREDRTWTCDPLVPNQVLYQAELLPVINLMARSKGFEPLTFWSVVKCSGQLSYERQFFFWRCRTDSNRR